MNLLQRDAHLVCFKSGLFLIASVLAVPCAFPVALSLGSSPPVPGSYDIYNFIGANMDMNNVYAPGNAPATNGAANDGYTYVANDRATQGQTFMTGSGAGGYLLTDIWVKHAGYTANTIDPSTPGSNGTWWQLAANGGFTVRITNPSKAGTAAFVLHSETYATMGTEGWPASPTSSLNGDGMWVHFALTSPVQVATNAVYGFDITSVSNNNAFFEWLGNSTNVFGGGAAYNGSTIGSPDDTLNMLVGDRVFLLRLVPQAHPGLSVSESSGINIQLSWPAANAGYQLQYSTNLLGPWNYSGLGISSLNGTNYCNDSVSNGMFYRLQYANGELPISVTSWQTNTDGLTLLMNPGTLRLQVYSPSVVRVAYSLSNAVPTNSFAVIATSTNSGWSVAQNANEIGLNTSQLHVRVNLATGATAFYDTNGAVIFAESPAGGKSLTPTTDGGFSTWQSQQQFLISPTEAIYGLGEHPAGLMNYRGSSIHLQNENPSQGSVPVLVSSRGYGIFWDNSAISDVSVAQSDATNLTWTSEAAGAVDYYFMYGPSLDNVIAGYRNLTGNPPLFGKWAWGLWQCRNHYTNQAEVLHVASTYRSLGFPLDCVIQDWQYWTPNPWGSHLFDTNRYPNVSQMMETLHGENVHLIISLWARFDTNILNANLLSAVNGLYTNVLPNVYPAGYGQWYDPFNSAARQVYWNEIATNLFNLGIDGWWLDASEPELSGNWGEYRSFTTAAGPGARVFNAFPLMHTAAVYQGHRATNANKRALILTRSAWAGQQRNGAVTWSGDINGNFGVLAQQIPAGLNFSISGIPYWNTDTGGFNDGSPNDLSYDEVFTRWFQFSTFCPMLRIHGNNDKAIYNFPTATQTILTNFDQLRYDLLPYIYSVSWMVTSQGYTMMRPLVMDFQADTNVFNISDQFMFGPALMPCPVTVSGATNRSVYLPFGSFWYDFWSGQTNAGGQSISSAATIDKLPLYVRAGSIIPYGPAVQYAMETNDPIELRVYRGADGAFTLYEDEGDNYNYEAGSYSTIPITWNESTQTLTLGNRQGSFPGMPASHNFRIVWVAADHGAGVAPTSTPDAVVSYSGISIQIHDNN